MMFCQHWRKMDSSSTLSLYIIQTFRLSFFSNAIPEKKTFKYVLLLKTLCIHKMRRSKATNTQIHTNEPPLDPPILQEGNKFLRQIKMENAKINDFEI